ncbi:hypothetical protein [Lentzea sp. NBRC 105346]|nr:hypothetical protein [Lentzea sp. NBRC 105346]
MRAVALFGLDRARCGPMSKKVIAGVLVSALMLAVVAAVTRVFLT